MMLFIFEFGVCEIMLTIGVTSVYSLVSNEYIKLIVVGEKFSV